MADMPTDFWGGYIVGVTVISLLVLAWLVYNVFFSGGTDPELADPDHVWDESLREGNNPAPMWWFWFILALMAFSVLYLIFYPGLGTYSGVLKWSQGGEVSTAMESYSQEFGRERSRITSLPYAEMRQEPAAMRAGMHLFNVNCSSCHGGDAQGQAMLFPNLADAEWQWGGSEAQIEQSITLGREPVMPPWQAALQDEGVAAVTEYTLALAAGRGADPEFASSKIRYDSFCIACHGATGEGNPALGGPALNDDVWLYGGDYDAVYESIANGRAGSMPGFGNRLNTQQIKLLTAWISGGATPP